MINTKTLSTKCAFLMFSAIEEIREPRRSDFLFNKNYEKAVEIFWKNIAMYHFYKKSLPEYVNKRIEEYNMYRLFLRKDLLKEFKLPILNIKSTKFVKFEYFKILFSTKKIIRYKKRVETKIKKIKRKVTLHIIKEAIKNTNSLSDVIILSNTDYIPSWFYDKVKEMATKKYNKEIIGMPNLINTGYRCIAFIPENVNIRKISKMWVPYNLLDTVCIYVSHMY